MEKNGEKKKEKMKKLDSHAKSSTISMILFRNVSLSRKKSTTRFGSNRFSEEKVTIFIGRETKTHILPKKKNEKIAKVIPSNNNNSFRNNFTIQQQQQQ